VSVAVAVFAAGRGSRLGGDASKPLLEWRGRPLLVWAVDAALDSGLTPVLITVGYRSADVRAALTEGDGAGSVERGKVEVVDNREWEAGIASSLRAAIDALGSRPEVTALCVGLADQPRVGPDAYRRLAAAHTAGAQLAVATYGARRGNPVLLARSLWPRAMELRGDAGARQLMKDRPVVEVPCDGTGTPDDVDTLEDLGHLQEDQ
jgi:molybdenum cofactor cytidylyltransferase/nicotine blue oxidoreductase